MHRKKDIILRQEELNKENNREEERMKKVVTFGVYDYFHLGYLRLFKNAKLLGDWLTVAVQDGGYILKTKPNAKVMYTTEQRKEMVSALRVVDDVVSYTDVDVTIKTLDFDIFAVGEDQNHEGFQRAIEWCKENGKEVVLMKRTPGICSSEIKNNL